ncbi:MAG: 23S rRNA pseudouridine(955/2504/2580) synthase RluC [Thiohalomonadaceae bacterium]
MTQPTARIIEVAAADEGQRIDNFLLTQLKGVPKSRIYRILRTGEVRVNSGRIKPTYRIKAGDAIRIPPIRVSEEEAPARPGDRVLERVNASLLYEDKGLLVVNKPSGLAVHGGSGLSYGLIEALRALRPEAPFLELGHRLDRDTSGCLVIAKKRSVLRAFHELLREGGSDKRYLALLKGRWRGGERRVEAALLKNVTQSGERLVKVSPEGKPALTIFRPLTVYKDATLVEAELITGRTHQVRVHAAHIGHPIAGDDKYGDEAFNKRMAGVGLKRLFLHASALSFTLPESGQVVSVSAPLDDELRSVLDRLEAE